MNTKKNVFKDSLVIGFAMFAVFFGAGNLVFPPQIGLVSGSSVFPAIIGLTFIWYFIPNVGGSRRRQRGDKSGRYLPSRSCKAAPGFHGCGNPGRGLRTIPRCGGVAYEIGLCGIFPSIQSTAVKWAFLLVFFGISFLLASSKSSVMDNIGKFITPILLICLLIIVVLTIVNPIGSPKGGVVENSFSNAFLTAINTGDVGTGILCGGIFIATLNSKGYKPGKEQKKDSVQRHRGSFHHPVYRIRRTLLPGFHRNRSLRS